ncbi:TauD/TfdA family dioxygenase [Streptomyces sp. NPDC059816]|uniref:TauD/TfdA family dioxygenase n=1 Tax=Streptomyces sp. NPDC059816 TaxID=3346960 RepID=UPI00365F5157
MPDTRTARTMEEGGASSLSAYVAQHLGQLRDDPLADGSGLFRDFGVHELGAFDDTIRALSGAPLAYAERSSPRSPIKRHIYTSTDYPANEEIFFHNENSCRFSWPLALYLPYVEPPHSLGATALADIRTVYELIEPAVREEFADRSWQVMRNLRDRRTTDTRSAVHIRPSTREHVWFNHAAFFHVMSPEPEVGSTLREYQFDYQRGDVLVIDSMLTAHSREPSTGPRRIAAAMAEAYAADHNRGD